MGKDKKRRGVPKYKEGNTTNYRNKMFQKLQRMRFVCDASCEGLRGLLQHRTDEG